MNTTKEKQEFLHQLSDFFKVSSFPLIPTISRLGGENILDQVMDQDNRDDQDDQVWWEIEIFWGDYFSGVIIFQG